MNDRSQNPPSNNPKASFGAESGAAKRPQPTAQNIKTSSQSGKKDKPIKGLDKVVMRNEFYRDGYRFYQKISFFQAVALVILLAITGYLINVNDKEYYYFATTEDGRLVPMLSLSQPNLGDAALLSWAAQSATETFTFGFNDYRKRLQEASRHFTRSGWAGFTNELEESKLLNSVVDNLQTVTAIPKSAPIIKEQGIRDDQYFWIVDVPLSVTYQSGAVPRSEEYVVQLTIVRVHRLESPNGVGIEKWFEIR